MLKILENEKDLITFSNYNSYDEDFADGKKEALRFCIRMHREKWDLTQFENDLKETIDSFTIPHDRYEKGIISGLEFNIKNMKKEIVTNE